MSKAKVPLSKDAIDRADEVAGSEWLKHRERRIAYHRDGARQAIEDAQKYAGWDTAMKHLRAAEQGVEGMKAECELIMRALEAK